MIHYKQTYNVCPPPSCGGKAAPWRRDFLLNPTAHVAGGHIAVGVTGRLIAVDCRILIQQVAGAAPGEALRGKPITDSVTGIRENHRPAKKRISRAM